MSDSILPEEDFKLLWKINNNFSDPNHSYESTYNLCRSIVSNPEYTPEDYRVTFPLIYQRYKDYHQVKSLIAENTPPDKKQYIKKDDQIKPIAEYLWNKLYMSETKMPENSMHYYFWGDMLTDEIVEHYTKFQAICRKERRR